MLIPPSRPWHRAENAEELLALSKKLGLTPKKAVEPKPLVYRDLLNGTSEPCALVGCEGDRYAIIDIGGGLHVIHIEAVLADMPVRLAHQTYRGRTGLPGLYGHRHRNDRSRPPDRWGHSHSARCAFQEAERRSTVFHARAGFRARSSGLCQTDGHHGRYACRTA